MPSDLYKNKYRIASARAPWWNYGWNAPYFITICTKNREHFFGEIRDRKMHLSEIGAIAQLCWHEIPVHFPFVHLDAFVVMPNHIHGIVVIDKPEMAGGDVEKMGSVHDVETLHATSLQTASFETLSDAKNEKMANISPKWGSLASVVRSYKSAVTQQSRITHASFAWQARYHDHIIRDDKSYQAISHYIRTNPENWEEDKFYGPGGN